MYALLNSQSFNEPLVELENEIQKIFPRNHFHSFVDECRGRTLNRGNNHTYSRKSTGRGNGWRARPVTRQFLSRPLSRQTLDKVLSIQIINNGIM